MVALVEQNMDKTLFSYYNHSPVKSGMTGQLFRCEAENIMEADNQVRLAGLNPQHLSCSAGIRIVVWRLSATKEIFHASVKSYRTMIVGGTIFQSKIFNTKDIALIESADILKRYRYSNDDILFWEYPSMAYSPLREWIKFNEK